MDLAKPQLTNLVGLPNSLWHSTFKVVCGSQGSMRHHPHPSFANSTSSLWLSTSPPHTAPSNVGKANLLTPLVWTRSATSHPLTPVHFAVTVTNLAFPVSRKIWSFDQVSAPWDSFFGLSCDLSLSSLLTWRPSSNAFWVKHDSKLWKTCFRHRMGAPAKDREKILSLL